MYQPPHFREDDLATQHALIRAHPLGLLSTAETAECLGVSEDLVKTRLHRARAMLRDNLYRRAGVTLESLYTFGNARCDRLVAAVMASIP